MPNVEVKVTGLDELQRDLNKLAVAISPKELQPILKHEADGFVAKLLPLTPVGPTGNLRRGVKAWTPKITARRPDAMARAGIKYKIAPHVHFIEYGTKERYNKAGAYRGYSPARPFIMPLAEKEMPGMLQRIIDAIWKVIEKNWVGRSGNA
jgi:hypothetical protein